MDSLDALYNQQELHQRCGGLELISPPFEEDFSGSNTPKFFHFYLFLHESSNDACRDRGACLHFIGMSADLFNEEAMIASHEFFHKVQIFFQA